MQGRKTEPYEVRIRVRRFTDDEWDRVLDAISARLGHAAALLDGELPPEIADDAAAPGSTCFPAAARSGRGAAARTTPTRASTRRRPAT